MVNEIKLYENQLVDYIKDNFKENALVEISYNRVFIPGKILYIDSFDDNVIITLQLQGQLLNQVVEIDINNILDEIIELRYTKDDKETTIIIK